MALLIEPLLNADVIILKTTSDKNFSGVAISVSGSRRDLTLAPKTFSEILIGTANVLLQCMAAAGIIQGKVAASGGAR
jgi:hypothetical protein